MLNQLIISLERRFLFDASSVSIGVEAIEEKFAMQAASHLIQEGGNDPEQDGFAVATTQLQQAAGEEFFDQSDILHPERTAELYERVGKIQQVFAEDFNHDGVSDIIFSGSQGSVAYLSNRDSGLYQQVESSTFGTFDVGQTYAFADLNADGWLDRVHLATDNGRQSLQYAIGGQGGGFQQVSMTDLGEVHTLFQEFSSVNIVDLDGDSTLEIVVSGRYMGAADQLRIFNAEFKERTTEAVFSSLLKTFNQQSFFVSDIGQTTMSFADFDHDGSLDLLRSGASWGHRLYQDILGHATEINLRSLFKDEVFSVDRPVAAIPWRLNEGAGDDLLFWYIPNNVTSQNSGELHGFVWNAEGEQYSAFSPEVLEESKTENTASKVTVEPQNAVPYFLTTLPLFLTYHVSAENNLLDEFTAEDDGALVYSLAESSQAYFEIDQTGALRVIDAAVQIGQTYEAVIYAKDSFGAQASHTVQVLIKQGNRAPVFAAGTSSEQVILEGKDSVIVEIQAHDPDGDPIEYSLSGRDHGLFSIDEYGQLRFQKPPDYEQPEDDDYDNLYLLTVHASDGEATVQKVFHVAVQDRAPIAPKVVFDDQDGNLYSNSPEVQVVALDHTQPWRYRFNGAPNWSATRYGNGVVILPEGVHRDFWLQSTDSYGEISEQLVFAQLTIDLTPPSAPGLQRNAFNMHQAVLSGSAEAGSEVHIILAGQEAVIVQVAQSGSWSWQTPFLQQGDYDLRLSSVDQAGNISLSHQSALVIDFVAPELRLDPVAEDNVINAVEAARTLVFSGQGEADAIVRVRFGDFRAETTIGQGGRWRVLLPAAPLDGVYPLEVQAQDPAGNVTEKRVDIRIDTVAPKIAQSNTEFWSNALQDTRGKSVFGASLLIDQPRYSIVVSGVASDSSLHGFMLRWGKFERYIETTASSVVLSVPATKIPLGKSPIYLYIRDAAGNVLLLNSAEMLVFRAPYFAEERPVSPLPQAELAGFHAMDSSRQELRNFSAAKIYSDDYDRLYWVFLQSLLKQLADSWSITGYRE